MLIIGERINGMYEGVREAIRSGDAEYVKKLAKDQVDAGAQALDVSVGPIRGEAARYMQWLVENISAVVDVPLSIDSPHPDVIKAGVEAASGRTIINSLKAAPEHIEKLIPLAVERGSEVICLLMNEKGIPADAAGKLEIAADLFTRAIEAGIPQEKIYFDPILLPLANAQKDVAETFEVMDQLRMLTSPPPHIIVGLSNLSQKAKHRSLLDRTYCVMAMSHGLDAAIMDPFDEELMNSVQAARMLLNQQLYAKSYLKV